MDLRLDDGAVDVVLSHRNLTHLLRGLDQFGWAQLARMTDQGILRVFAQEDEDHYEGRVAGPGMKPFFEAAEALEAEESESEAVAV